jgi:hypothetical protein
VVWEDPYVATRSTDLAPKLARSVARVVPVSGILPAHRRPPSEGQCHAPCVLKVLNRVHRCMSQQLDNMISCQQACRNLQAGQ